MTVKKMIVSLTLAGAMMMTAAPALAVVTGADVANNQFGLSYGTATGLGNKDIRKTISQIINVALSLLGIVALVIILVGGFKWMTAGGNEEKVGEARKLIFAGITGLAVILASFAIARFVLAQLAAATGAGGATETGALD